MTSTVLRFYELAAGEFDRRVRAVGDGDWGGPTPCTTWDVRTLVNHIVNECLWVEPLVAGSTIAEVGDRFDGDVLGDDAVQSWVDAAASARVALTADGALIRTVHLSFGDTDAEDYAWQLVSDLTLHAWDLARSIGADDTLDPELVDAVTARLEPARDMLAASGVFGSPIPVPDDADAQTKLLAIVGRTS